MAAVDDEEHSRGHAVVTRAELKAAGFDVNAEAFARLSEFVRLLRAENEKLNLTGTREEAELWRAHVCDSLALWPVLRGHRVQWLVDLGSGGGLPGLPLACVDEELDVTLLDATRKKWAAVQRISTGLGLARVRAVWGRAEVLAHDPAYRERFDAVTARAVATLPVLLEYAAGFVRVGGHGWFFKSVTASGDEAAQAESAARRCQLSAVEPVRYKLAGDEDERMLMAYRKEAVLSAKLPRGTGRARKNPL